ncbi:sodium/potassium/calcium exchanger 1-like isoform X4 [Gadus chalcogrammus]|uniref:sodium/potassium/calcium exchanger 1-like isoform X4 n=1 Tax=Gadus chalcogrammus TaxID=1042646 RepID=UPI0024C4D62F|nr:sodium/potassium/calcium exchanger 1-like isoform X4 [Gadus chalcogrammus]
MHRPQRRRLQWSRVLFFISAVLLCCLYALTLRAKLSEPRSSSSSSSSEEEEQEEEVPGQRRHTREVTSPNVTETATVPPGHLGTPPPLVITVNRTDIEQCIYVEPATPVPRPTERPPPDVTVATSPTPPPPAPPTSDLPPLRKGDYPEDMFSVEQRQQGWVALHLVGMVYMFVALAIVCDEFFVPTLEVITDKLEISDDVAGATFMAAGGSAPELFTSLIGVFISHSNVGIGTIVGSAVFNILFVIGMCAIFSREMLHLTWWPLFRDVSFYILDLVMLIAFFLDNVIMWWESAMLVMGYVSYVIFMKFNSPIERAVKRQINKHVNTVKVWTAEEPTKDSEQSPPPPPPPPPPPGPKEVTPKAEPSPVRSRSPAEPQEGKIRLRVRPVLQRGGSSASLHNASLRCTIFQLMIHTLDPLGEDDELEPAQTSAPSGQAGEPSTSQQAKSEKRTAGGAGEQANTAKETVPEAGESDGSGDSDGEKSSEVEDSSEASVGDANEEEEKAEEEMEEPLSLEWPDTRRKQATYLILLPIVFPLWLTVPDVRNPASRKFFAMTFMGSILWIGVFSYLMVWWAHQVGETVGISEEIMGLTILAAGTSIPDLITSVIVARKGLGDMAVSSSVGSNIFDITIGLPVPWLMYSLSHGNQPIQVRSNGLFCAIVLLFLMLLFVIISIAACRWRMSRGLGLTMFVLYFLFLVLSVMLEDRILTCPVSI